MIKKFPLPSPSTREMSCSHEVGLFSPGSVETGEWRVRRVCVTPRPLNTLVTFRPRWRGLGWGDTLYPQHTPRKAHSALWPLGPSLGHSARPLLAPHFVDPGFLGPGVGLVFFIRLLSLDSISLLFLFLPAFEVPAS